MKRNKIKYLIVSIALICLLIVGCKNKQDHDKSEIVVDKDAYIDEVSNPKDCVELWQQDHMSDLEVLRCIDRYEQEFQSNESNKEKDKNLNRSVIVERTDKSINPQNFTHPEVCVQQWREGIISLEEAVRCTDRYMRNNEQQK